MPIGSKINFQSVLLKYSPPEMSTAIRNWESLEGTLLSLTFSDLKFHRIEGSAVIVAPGIALCASHVVEPRLEALLTGTEAPYCFGITSAGLQIWKVLKVNVVPGSDLTVLGLELASELESGATLYRSTITTRVPEVGERVTIYGFRAGQDEFERTADPNVRFSASVLVCAGEVAQHYLDGRDRVMLPWPTLEIACPSWGGMSGGPVFDSTGKVLGLLSSSLSTNENDGPSYVSLLHPALTTRFEGGWPASLFRNTTTLRELSPKFCSID